MGVVGGRPRARRAPFFDIFSPKFKIHADTQNARDYGAWCMRRVLLRLTGDRRRVMHAYSVIHTYIYLHMTHDSVLARKKKNRSLEDHIRNEQHLRVTGLRVNVAHVKLPIDWEKAGNCKNANTNEREKHHTIVRLRMMFFLALAVAKTGRS